MCMLLTGMMAASMIAGCGNSGNASANAGADTNTDASTDASGAADNSTDQQQMSHQIRQQQVRQQNPEILTTVSTSTLYPVRMVPVQEALSSSCSV